MASRDELIEQFARDLVGGGTPTIPARQLAVMRLHTSVAASCARIHRRRSMSTTCAREALRVALQAVDAITTPELGSPSARVGVREAVRCLAEAGLLATPVQQDTDLVERGRQLASERDDLIAAGADPSELEVPLAADVPRRKASDFLVVPLVPNDATVKRVARALHHHGCCTCEDLSTCLEDVRVVVEALVDPSVMADHDDCPACALTDGQGER